jgi:hypothetical protein
MVNSKILILEDDILEILHNDLLSKKPYLIRMTNFSNEFYELRADEDDLSRLYEILRNLLNE